ncbi:molecular chaperone [Shewanella sp. SNU WT4]|uniref:fimbrial biogenesis chaperone n=1 Tax=Shewanella sp. SNU WT4 TaxID=2590015 RepID=UPI0011281FA3|nr:fimbria/pilus periplasmic chaperone [Shewanella sp. SNU WT4]QDF65354.1 molecular chaperone [Shewanella sp. SNU WT4]
MVDFISDQGQQSERFFKVNNTTDKPLPLEVFIQQRLVTGEASEQLQATDDFMVFPPQVLIPPGKTQTVKVKYIGVPVAESLSYRVVFSQLPIADDASESSIKMLFQIGALLFVTSDKLPQKLTTELTANPNEWLVTNTGAGVLTLSAMTFGAKAGKQSYRWTWDDIKTLVERQYLAPRQSVRINAVSILSNNEQLTQVEASGY